MVKAKTKTQDIKESKPTPKNAPIPQETKDKVIELRKAGKTYREIEKETGISKASIGTILNPPGTVVPCKDPEAQKKEERTRLTTLVARLHDSLDRASNKDLDRMSVKERMAVIEKATNLRENVLKDGSASGGFDGMGIGELIARAHKAGMEVKLTVKTPKPTPESVEVKDVTPEGKKPDPRGGEGGHQA